jgi:hypothetical protein
MPSNSDKVLAFLVIALNPRRPYDDDYKAFIHLLTHQITTPQLSAVILREEVERRAQLARKEAIDRERLSRQLSESETKFARFATRAPIGFAVLTPEGFALSANGKLLLHVHFRGTVEYVWPISRHTITSVSVKARILDHQ